MKHVTITGTYTQLDRIIEQYISRYDIQLELNENADAFAGINPYAEIIKKCENFFGDLTAPDDGEIDLSNDEALDILSRASAFFEEREAGVRDIKKEADDITEIIDSITPYRDIDFNFADLREFKHITYRFGKIPIAGFKQFEAFLYDDSDIIFLEGRKTEEFIWCVYFTPASVATKSASILNSLHFVPVDIPVSYGGSDFMYSPRETAADLLFIKKEIESSIESSGELPDGLNVTEGELSAALYTVKRLYMYYDCRKYNVSVTDDYFTFAGWMTENDADDLAKETEHDGDIIVIFENTSQAVTGKPPTKLKNNFFVRPFEFFTKMYGVPNYNELDPTPLVAVTYSLFFGMMFGDVGQGAVLSAAGYFILKIKKAALGGIVLIAGLFSTLFGFLYGSLFGIESDNVLPAILMKPSKNIILTLITAVSFGAVLLCVCIVFNMINAAKSNDKGRFLIGPNGLTGLIFYLIIISAAALYAVGIKIGFSSVFLLLLPFIITIMFREPLTRLINDPKIKNKIEKRESPGIFIIESAMGLLEAMLAYFTNTVSFMRIGGFAICHAGLMTAVMALSESNGTKNIAVIVIGNIFVIFLEGIIVGIQALRLQFYELFSRYYKGDGVEFVSYRNVFNNNKIN